MYTETHQTHWRFKKFRLESSVMELIEKLKHEHLNKSIVFMKLFMKHLIFNWIDLIRVMLFLDKVQSVKFVKNMYTNLLKVKNFTCASYVAYSTYSNYQTGLRT